jgi:hypothetical protein
VAELNGSTLLLRNKPALEALAVASVAVVAIRCCAPVGSAPHFSNSEDQFRMTDKGAELEVSTRVLTRNFCPSAVTS